MCTQEREDKVYDAQFTSQDFELTYGIQLHLPLQQQSTSKCNTNLKHDNWMLL